MITRIELTNFMAHRHTVIEPAAGLTVLVGPNNVGKSAVVAALQVLCQNESAAYVMRHGERECSVAVQTSDGHNIEWRRKNSTQRYVIDGQNFDRLKGKTPDELHQALRLPMVDAESGGDFDVHFGTQKSPIFLLNSPGANRARFFASSSDAIQLVAMQKRHKVKLSDRQKEKLRLEAESRKLNEELEALGPVSEIDQQVAVATKDYEELIRFKGWLKEAETHEESLDRQMDSVKQCAAVAKVFCELAAPPVLEGEQSLKSMIIEVAAATTEHEKGAARGSVLAHLQSPPELAATNPMEELIGLLEVAENMLAQAKLQAETMRALSTPPTLKDLAPLGELTDELSFLVMRVERQEQERSAVSSLDRPPLLAETAELGQLIEALASANLDQQSLTAELQLLSAVVPPPDLCEEAPLRGLEASIAGALSQRDSWQGTISVLTCLAEPPVPVELERLAEIVCRLEVSTDEARSCEQKDMAAAKELRIAAKELMEQAQGAECPICGSVLDATTVLARAAAGLGGHVHA